MRAPTTILLLLPLCLSFPLSDEEYFGQIRTYGPAFANLTNDQLENFVEQSSQQLGIAFSHFTQSMYLHLAGSQSDNFVFSPLSLHSALSMLYLGTTKNSTTQDELGIALGSIRNKNSLKTGYNHIVTTYKSQPSFLYGNHFWVQDGILLNENFTETVKNNLNSGAENINFGAPGAVDTVNQWVSKMTGGKIEKLVDSFSSSTALFLANALYFKEEWLVPFDDTDYQGEPLLDEFITKDGKVTANFIQQYNNNATYGEIEIQGDHVVPVVTLPYKNDLFEMQIIAPKSIQDLKWLEEKMKLSNEQDLTDSSDSYFNLFSTPKDLEDLQYNEFNDGEDVEIYLKMPTFQARSDVDVVEPLQKLGAKKVFGPGAELEELASGPLSVSKIKHIALVDVTKEGTEGAAATGAEIVLLSASFRDRKDINVVSPFIFIVQDKQNNIPILVGKIMDPTIKIP